eukprot:12746694-Alexandrium_andersonii.AAC.1
MSAHAAQSLFHRLDPVLPDRRQAHPPRRSDLGVQHLAQHRAHVLLCEGEVRGDLLELTQELRMRLDDVGLHLVLRALLVKEPRLPSHMRHQRLPQQRPVMTPGAVPLRGGRPLHLN